MTTTQVIIGGSLAQQKSVIDFMKMRKIPCTVGNFEIVDDRLNVQKIVSVLLENEGSLSDGYEYYLPEVEVFGVPMSEEQIKQICDQVSNSLEPIAVKILTAIK